MRQGERKGMTEGEDRERQIDNERAKKKEDGVVKDRERDKKKERE